MMGRTASTAVAGVDLNLENGVSSHKIAEAVRSGLLAEADLDRAVANVLRAKFTIGLFEHPYVDIDDVPETLDSPEERQLARTVAEKSVVLLQNGSFDGAPVLPLTSTPRTIAVIGPNADRPMGQLPNYSYPVLDSITKRFALAADPQTRMEAAAESRAGQQDLLEAIEIGITRGLPAVPSLVEVSRRHNMSTRTLRRRLAACDTTYEAIVDRVRRDRVEQLLSRPRTTFRDVARQVGFSDERTLRRAVARWHDVTPSRLRDELHGVQDRPAASASSTPQGQGLVPNARQ